MKPTLPVFIYLLTTISYTQARVHDFETIRTKSTAGAGVASLLTSEAPILNPAPLAFFDYSTILLQKSEIRDKGEATQMAQANPTSRITDDSDSLGVIVTDSKNRMKGGLAYLKQQEAADKRTRFAASFAYPMGKKSAIGATYRYTIDKQLQGAETKRTYHQTVLGVTHALKDDFTIGAVLVDPARANSEDNRLLLGGQYQISDILSLMLDTGMDYTDDLSNTLLWRAALQLRFFKDFFLRIGTFQDKGLREKGNAAGISWASPKLIFDLALKTTKPTGEPLHSAAYGYKVRELGASVAYRF